MAKAKKKSSGEKLPYCIMIKSEGQGIKFTEDCRSYEEATKAADDIIRKNGWKKASIVIALDGPEMDKRAKKGKK